MGKVFHLDVSTEYRHMFECFFMTFCVLMNCQECRQVATSYQCKCTQTLQKLTRLCHNVPKPLCHRWSIRSFNSKISQNLQPCFEMLYLTLNSTNSISSSITLDILGTGLFFWNQTATQHYWPCTKYARTPSRNACPLNRAKENIFDLT